MSEVNVELASSIVTVGSTGVAFVVPVRERSDFATEVKEPTEPARDAVLPTDDDRCRVTGTGHSQWLKSSTPLKGGNDVNVHVSRKALDSLCTARGYRRFDARSLVDRGSSVFELDMMFQQALLFAVQCLNLVVKSLEIVRQC